MPEGGGYGRVARATRSVLLHIGIGRRSKSGASFMNKDRRGRVHQKWIQNPKMSFCDNTCFDVHGPCNVTVHCPSSPFAWPAAYYKYHGRPRTVPSLLFRLSPAFVHIRSIYSYSLYILHHSCVHPTSRALHPSRTHRPTVYFLCPLWSLPHPQPLRLTRILLSPSLTRVPLLALSPLPPSLSLPFLPLDLPA